ncbi:1,4-alpha-glucan branching enzyme [Aquisphaera giovannonii]|uniref:1,4-alpha-glucan branching enzyme n=1 Tax=Aquisphaera giovannonii TaxID=406548 RepID=A0A5B9W652_9BACT|nr:1,4-alpha-glucan branching protein domain-containing protein [Aquisphaera giovannonii]QEH36156.1 1,4-alpha-glucan branching enzyme [Aquisphaera giovannonii]
MLSLALILELHHPLPGPDDVPGLDWASAAIDGYWPLLRAVSDFAGRPAGAAITIAVSPSWTALAADAGARNAVEIEWRRRDQEAPGWGSRGPVRDLIDRWDGDAVALLRELGESGAVELIATTSTFAWLPSLAGEPAAARAQVCLAAADHARRFGSKPAGIWLPFLGYAPGLESYVGEAGARYFGVAGDALVRGTVLPPASLSAPLITPPGVAAFGVNPAPAESALDAASGYRRDPRYADAAAAGRAAEEQAEHFVSTWTSLAMRDRGASAASDGPVSVAALPAHDLGRDWPAAAWLGEVLSRLSSSPDARAVCLGRHLDLHPTGVVGRPGPSAGGMMAARPGDSDLYDRCRVAAEMLSHAVEHRGDLGPTGRRAVAHMARALLRAQQVDWSLPPGLGVSPEVGLRRAFEQLDRFHALAGMLMTGRPDRDLLDRLDRGPAFLPSIDLDHLAGARL